MTYFYSALIALSLVVSPILVSCGSPGSGDSDFVAPTGEGFESEGGGQLAPVTDEDCGPGGSIEYDAETDEGYCYTGETTPEG